MTNTRARTITLLAACGLILAGMLFMFTPRGADAAQTTSRLGGGNALLRATGGLAHANLASDILARLTFASTNGGQPDPIPSDGDNGADATSAGGAGGNGGNNGGATAGNGGNGGDGGNAAAGGLVRAGNVVSNSTALNVINATIVRISIGR